MKWIAIGDKLLVTYYEVTDMQLQVIKNNSQYYADKDFVNEIMVSKGKNAHVFCIIAEEPLDWSDEWNKRAKDYVSLSWWNRDENKFYIKEGLCHQQQSE
jgi:hypothetical protein